jgi:hypothetical protein
MKPPARQHTSRARRAVETYEPPSSLGNDPDSGASDSTCRGPSQGVPPGVADDFSDVLEVLSLRARWGVSSRSCPRLLRGRGVPPGPNSPTSSLRSWACSESKKACNVSGVDDRAKSHPRMSFPEW